MKISVLQPHYSFNEKDGDACFLELPSLLDRCDETMDLIVLPEYSDALADVEGKEGLRFGFLTCRDFYFYENFARFTNSQLRGIS